MVMILGIDTSNPADNGIVDWKQVKKAGVRFAILRATYGDAQDRIFATYWPQLADAGIMRGSYAFWRPLIDPERQADAVIRALGTQRGDFPVALDLEFPGGIRKTGLTPEAGLERFMRFWKSVRDRLNVTPLLYTSKRVWVEELGNPPAPAGLTESPLWCPRYYQPGVTPVTPPAPEPWGRNNLWIHQYRGNVVDDEIPGFKQDGKGKLDLNRFLPMSLAEKGSRVSWLQRVLGLKPDGDFGPKTLAAVKSFQTTHGLAADGVIGPATFSKLAWANR